MKKYFIYALIAIVLIALGSLGVNKFINTIEKTAYESGYQKAKAEQGEAVVEEKVQRDQKEYQLRTLNDPDLAKRYCRWVYNISYDECVSSYQFIK